MLDPEARELSVFITSPQGCSYALEGFTPLRAQLDPQIPIIFLEYKDGDCLEKRNEMTGTRSVRHRYFDTQDEFEMRSVAAAESGSRFSLFLEDHTVVDENFATALLNLLRSETPAALTFYSKNGTADSFAGRVLYQWVWGFASVENFPRMPEPVCSAFLVSTEHLAAWREENGGTLRLGELETKVIPTLVRKHPIEHDRELCFKHYEDVSFWGAIVAVFSNAAISASVEKELLEDRGWFAHMRRRYFGRYGEAKSLRKLSFAMKTGLMTLAIAGFVGAISGRGRGPGKAHSRLAHAHPKVHQTDARFLAD